ncbi:MAG: hypothetical protein Q9227_003908 [Pyrenula ochraceoflavens]
MSAFQGRSGPNLSQYLDELNVIPTDYDLHDSATDEGNLDQTLAMFTNTEFMDFDAAAQSNPSIPMNYDYTGGKFADTDFGTGDVKFEDLLRGEPLSMLQSSYATPGVPPPPTYQTAPMSASPTGTSPLSPTALKQPSSSGPPDPTSLQEESQKAAEDDKRRRNTAASARFRVKKKMKEQAMEKRVKEIDAENAAMKAKIGQLEMENKWLKNLVIEKNGKQTEKDLSEAYQKFRQESEERDERKGSERKDGVGTKA